jgi:hypothetical protein
MNYLLHLGLPIGLFASGFPTEILYEVFIPQHASPIIYNFTTPSKYYGQQKL